MADYHSRMERLSALVHSGKFGRVEVAAVFSGKVSRPIQVALRDRETLIVSLWDLHADGTLSLPNVPSELGFRHPNSAH